MNKKISGKKEYQFSLAMEVKKISEKTVNEEIEKIAEDEVFKRVKGYPRYFISNYGRAVSVCSGKPEIIKQHIRGRLNPYCYINARRYYGKTRKEKKLYIHQLVAFAFCYNPLKGFNIKNIDVHHLDGDRLNNKASNLMILPRNIHKLIETFPANQKFIVGGVGETTDIQEFFNMLDKLLPNIERPIIYKIFRNLKLHSKKHPLTTPVLVRLIDNDTKVESVAFVYRGENKQDYVNYLEAVEIFKQIVEEQN